MADSSEVLPDDLWYVIGKKLGDAADCIRFRSVCRRWRRLLPFPQPPWLVLAEDNQTPDTRGFFGLGRSQPQQDGVGDTKHEQEQDVVYQFQLPEAYQARCVGSTGAWLITIDLQERIRVLNPFSRVHFDLPPQITMEFGPPREGVELSPVILRDGNINKAIIYSPPSSSSSSSSSCGGDCIVMVIFSPLSRIGYARPGYPAWITLPTSIRRFQDIIFYRDQFYAINMRGQLLAFTVGDGLNPPTSTLVCSEFVKNVDAYENQKYLVEWMGELLFVIKFMDEEDTSWQVNRFEIYRFDFAKKEWSGLNNLGEYSLFLGFNTSIAVMASHYLGLKKNSIYFTDDYWYGYICGTTPGGFDMGVYDLDNNSVQPHYKGTSTSTYSPPFWIVPPKHL